MNPILHSLARHPQTRLGLALAAIAITQSAAPAATVTWNQLAGGDASGSWATAANPPWSTGALPATTDTADFSTLNLTADSTVTLDGNQSIYALNFGDTITSSAANWILNPGTPGTSTLTLAVFDFNVQPRITVNSMGSGKSATIGAALLGSYGFTKAGAGTLNLSGNSGSGFTGTLNMIGGTIAVNGGGGGSLSGNNLTFGTGTGALYDAGTLILDNANATGATALSLGTLNVAKQVPADNTVQISRSAEQDVTLTFSALQVAANVQENGPVVNFVVGGTAGTVNGVNAKIVLNNVTTGSNPAIGVSTDRYYWLGWTSGQGLNAYFNGGDFAVYDPNNYVRGINYGTDFQSQTYAAGSNLIPAAGVDNVEITGSIDSQVTASLGTAASRRGTLKIKGSDVNLTLANDAVLTLLAGPANSGISGLLKTGGGASTISGSGTAKVAFTPVQADFRVDTATDVLTISVPVTTQSKARVMKSGAGRLVLSGGFSSPSSGFYETYINGGTLEIGGSGTWSNLATSARSMLIASGASFVLDSTASLTFPGVIKGGGGVTVKQSTLTLNAANEYTGGSTVATNGTLVFQKSASKPATGTTTVAAGATLGLGVGGTGTFISSDVDALWADTLSNVTMDPAARVGIDTTLGPFTYTAAQSTPQSPHGLTKLGANTLTLAGTYTYTGNTTVNAGTLSIGSAYLADTSTVTIATGAVLDLNTAGASDTIAALVLGGVTMDPGTYNASTHPSYFTGTGSLVVGGTSTSAYTAWAGGLTNPAFDFDSDLNGIPNGLQWILGGTTSEPNPSAILPGVTGSAATGLTLVFSRNADSIAETTLMVEWGSVLNPFTHTLVIGTTDVGPSGNNPTIDIDAPTAGKVTVNIPAANAPDGKLFARLKATQP